MLSNELFANLRNNNREGTRFILGHEIAHVRLHHVALWYNLVLCYSQLIPMHVSELVDQGRRLGRFWAEIAQLPRPHPWTVRRVWRLHQLGLFGAPAAAGQAHHSREVG